MTIAPIDLGIHTEDPEVDMIDVMEFYRGVDLVTIGGDGFIEVFDDEGCDTLEDDEDTKVNFSKS